MAQYRAIIKGSRGEASRLGHKASGIRAEVNGWNMGILVYGRFDPEKGDIFEVYLTGGSKGYHDRILIGAFAEAEHKKGDQLVAKHLATCNARSGPKRGRSGKTRLNQFGQPSIRSARQCPTVLNAAEPVYLTRKSVS